MQQPHSHCSQRGFTALELIIVLVIGFSIIALSASKMGDLFSSSKATQAVSNILALATAVREFSGPNGYDPGDQVTPLNSADMIPKPLKVNAAGRLLNEWNGPITIRADAQNRVTMAYPLIPQKACNKIAKNLLSSSTFKSITGESNTSLTATSTAANILTACTPVAGTAGATLTFVM